MWCFPFLGGLTRNWIVHFWVGVRNFDRHLYEPHLICLWNYHSLWHDWYGFNGSQLAGGRIFCISAIHWGLSNASCTTKNSSIDRFLSSIESVRCRIVRFPQRKSNTEQMIGADNFPVNCFQTNCHMGNMISNTGWRRTTETEWHEIYEISFNSRSCYEYINALRSQ